ncbi:hypothetical protein [Dermatobacter hominis]|uniref:hypothetical protein n=1 Tax=Dermatobacter hominis TaxID=2884263 RepID=UPI001D12744C|nr:hypothetical protein [Dermatobacter hominis]UDY34664.1 hypothetical protein LH044_15145 [Dermatobacter hominis]
MNRHVVPTTLVAAALALAACTAPPGPGSTIDQRSEAPATSTWFMSCPHDLLRVQTFTAGRTGTMDRVSLRVTGPFDPGSPQGPATEVAVALSIQTVNGAHAPSGTEIGSGDLQGPPSGEWADVPLSTPAPVTAGTQYAIVILTRTGCHVGFGLVANDDDPYPGGAVWTTTAGSSALSFFADTDLGFRTWVR